MHYINYLDIQVGVQQHLELESFGVLVLDLQGGGEAVFGQCDTINEPELIWPSVLELLA